MELRLKGNISTHKVEVRSLSKGCLAIIDDREYAFDSVKINHQTMSLIIDGFSYDVYFTENQGLMIITVNGSEYEIELEQPKHGQRSGGKAKIQIRKEPVEVFAPMPGKVIKVLCKQGSEVDQGDGLVIIEAMKMENELASPSSGRINKIHVEEGSTVEANQPLISIG